MPTKYFSCKSTTCAKIETGVNEVSVFLVVYYYGFCLDHILCFSLYSAPYSWLTLATTVVYSGNILHRAQIWVCTRKVRTEKERGLSPVESLCHSPPRPRLLTNALVSNYQVDAENYSSTVLIFFPLNEESCLVLNSPDKSKNIRICYTYWCQIR